MKKIILIFIIHSSLSAQNLVVNANFENGADCPMYQNMIEFALGWTSCGDSADYFNACSPSGSQFTTPSNWGGYQVPSSGIAYVALHTYAPYINNNREFIGSSLISPLTAGIKYFVSMKVNLSLSPGIGSSVATNKLGIKFSSHSYSAIDPISISNVAHIYSDSIITDTSGWTLISGSFIADSAYTNIIIGNHFDDSNTTAIVYHDTANSFAYYYIDDVCVSADSLTCNPTLSVVKIPEQIPYIIYPNPASDHCMIEFAKQPDTSSRILLFDVFGRKMLIIENVHTTQVMIQRDRLPSGTYYFQLMAAEKPIASGKLIFKD